MKDMLFLHNEVISQGRALILLRQYKPTCLNLHDEAVGIIKCHQRFRVSECFAEGITLTFNRALFCNKYQSKFL